MVTPSAGGIVLVPFPFSDLSQAKLRPAVALADAGRGDWVLCQVTSNPYGDPRAAKYLIYRDLVMAVDKYCMQMGALLFESGVDYNEIEDHIGKNTFKAHLPKEIWFAVGPDKQPEIPDAINDMIEPHRLRAVELMDQLVAE